MSYYENEILKELEVNGEYTEREIRGFVAFNKEAIVLCEDTVHFNASNRETTYKVSQKLETHVHKNQNNSYLIPNDKTKIYIINKI